MTTDEKTTQNGGTRESSFNCGDMMKMMSRCMEGKGEKIDFEQFCGKMSDFCRDMMKNMEDKNKVKGE
jgi:hypothetical protein